MVSEDEQDQQNIGNMINLIAQRISMMMKFKIKSELVFEYLG